MGLSLAVGFAGYTLVYFGWCSVRGPGVGLLDLVIPGRTVTIPAGGSGSGGGDGTIGSISGPDAIGGRVVTPNDGGRPYRLVPDGPNGQYSQEPIGPTPGSVTT